MRRRGPTLLLVLMLLLGGGAAAALAADRAAQPGRARASLAFQRLVGGLGFGPAADLTRCAFSFDPRLCPACPRDAGPVPGGAVFCAHHSCAILAYPPLPSAADAPPR